jgi:histidine triad (HIT) family protein
MCVFCDIVEGRMGAEIVYEDDISLAFLDNRPLFPGHTLLVPREHHETLTDLPEEMIAPLFSAARRLSGAVQEAMGSDGTLVLMNNKVSQSVPHLHIHVIPRKRKDGLRGFLWPRHPYKSEAHMAEVAEAIRTTLAARR